MKRYIEVNITYARIALILLTMNFALTTYAIIQLAGPDEKQSTSATPQTTEQTSAAASN